jgi:hypothetical protein
MEDLALFDALLLTWRCRRNTLGIPLQPIDGRVAVLRQFTRSDTVEAMRLKPLSKSPCPDLRRGSHTPDLRETRKTFVALLAYKTRDKNISKTTQNPSPSPDTHAQPLTPFPTEPLKPKEVATTKSPRNPAT